jgi:LPS export ABC transporter protein LptC
MLKSPRLLWGIGAIGLVGLISVGLVSLFVANRRNAIDRMRDNGNDLSKFDNSLTFNNVTLEQADDKGQLWWKVKAVKATYKKDQEMATVEQPEGELFQDGKAIFKLKGTKAEIIQDGKSIKLRGPIIATDLRDGTQIQGKEIEWQPSTDRLLVREQFVAQHKKIKLVGEEGRFSSRKREAEILGKVVVEVKEPRLRMQTKQLTWWLDQQRLASQQPIQINRIENGKVTDQAAAKQGSYQLKEQIATLKNDANVFIPAQNLQAKGNELVWNLRQKLVSATQPITFINAAQQVTLSGDRGQFDITKKLATLTGNVRGLSLLKQASISADNLIWFLTTQSFEATGNVNYQQTNPPVNLIGTKAAGKIQNQQVEITGGPEADNRVVTEIVPNFNR